MRKLCAVSQSLLLPHHLPCQASCSCFHTFAWAIHDHSSLLPLLLTCWWFNSPIGVFDVCSSITSPPRGLSSSIRLDEASSWHGGLRFQKNGEIESTLSPKACPQKSQCHICCICFIKQISISTGRKIDSALMKDKERQNHIPRYTKFQTIYRTYKPLDTIILPYRGFLQNKFKLPSNPKLFAWEKKPKFINMALLLHF